MKLARTIRFDPSDLNVFPVVAEEGEWALVGTFCFADVTPDALNGKLRQAFSNGFLGVESFGFSTLVSVVSVRDGEADRLAGELHARLRYARIDQVFDVGLKKFLGGVRGDIATLSDEIGRQFLLD